MFQTYTMKLALFLLAVLPFTLGASIDEKRFIEGLLGGVDILDLAKQVLNQFGCDETETQCEQTMCPQVVNKLDFGNSLITALTCGAVCKEVQVLSKTFGSSSATGVDPCSGSFTG
ncbi:uncharacterized protein LOC123564748 [Mercenaria mercenaria]|uniref:uncharacterized protein LOC123564748 n=1 Tax=Mercenaria mercenaria TaxID=6596 RepID=UPI00234F6B18|nr:uncharacterized protein LOC123564748 [Mercenaria mercenaria]